MGGLQRHQHRALRSRLHRGRVDRRKHWSRQHLADGPTPHAVQFALRLLKRFATKNAGGAQALPAFFFSHSSLRARASAPTRYLPNCRPPPPVPYPAFFVFVAPLSTFCAPKPCSWVSPSP